eukprot:8243488-Lingulodinium_polyedra.AAC.1
MEERMPSKYATVHAAPSATTLDVEGRSNRRTIPRFNLLEAVLALGTRRSIAGRRYRRGSH